MKDAILETKELSYTYPDGTQALTKMTCGFEKGKTTAVLGGNGAGKSTLFLSLNGILKPTGGKVLFKGCDIDYSKKGLKELRQSVGIVFQDPDNQLFSASVFQDVSYGPANMKLSEAEIRQRVSHAMERTGIAHLKDRPTHNLSFGQKKRVAIAGILAMKPEVIVLDEPTAGLDPMGVSEIMKLMSELKEELELTILISTHDIDIVPLYCDYTFVMDHGKIVLEGTPKQVFSRPEAVRNVNLRLPRIGHLMEILKDKDEFVFEDTANTIGEARKILKHCNKK